VNAFIIPIQFVDGAPGHGTRVDHVKVFRNGPDMRFEGRIHEQILPSVNRRGGEIHRLGGVVILHSGYDTSVEGQARKRVRDDTILALELKERPNHPFVLFNVGMTRHYEGRHKEAVKWLKKCLRVVQPGEMIEAKTYFLLAVSQRELGDIEEALATVEKGLTVVPGDPELHFAAGQLLAALERCDEALKHYQEVLKADIGGKYSSIDMGILSYKTFINMGVANRSLGRFREAKECFLKAIESAPDFTPSVFELFDTSLECGDLSTAIEMLKVIEQREGQDENWAKMLLRYAGAASTRQSAIPTLQDAIFRSQTPTIGARLVLARELLEGGQEAKALPLLGVLQSEGVAEAFFLQGVYDIQRGDFKGALKMMEKALALNPGHVQTREQVEILRAALKGEEGPN
jgi:tetratricopeptide (TPR) repeat protein